MKKNKSRSSLPGFIRRLAKHFLKRIAVNENVTVGDNLNVGRGVVISSPHGLRIGKHVSIGPRSIIQVNGVIGDYALIGMGVQIVGRYDHALTEIGRPLVRSTWVGDREERAEDSVHIERDVWIGGASVILSGVTIGQGSIVGAGSVVTKDIPENSIAVGVPARIVGNRFQNHDDFTGHFKALDLLQE